MAHREPQPLGDVLADQGRVQGGREDPFGPAAPGQLLDQGGVGRPLAHPVDGGAQRLADLLAAGLFGGEGQHPAGRGLQGFAAGRAVHQQGVRPGREPGRRVPVALRGALQGQLEDEPRVPADQQPERRRPGQRPRPALPGFRTASRVPIPRSPNPERQLRSGPRLLYSHSCRASQPSPVRRSSGPQSDWVAAQRR